MHLAATQFPACFLDADSVNMTLYTSHTEARILISAFNFNFLSGQRIGKTSPKSHATRLH